ncbi:Protein CBG20600 [Caenorhabditis briggsae]|uniref:Protein CBG20600 n=1 Tax=Caenorhabditis briggsae TaxID=6238 RepID=A8XY63_CAEBR|nr:Protein CBG20600 [Caenorhabditis briggsae]CAP37580.1 Protein CBG20600 [Caenorhabditis briggsae]
MRKAAAKKRPLADEEEGYRKIKAVKGARDGPTDSNNFHNLILLLVNTQDPGPRTQDPGPRTQDPGPRTQDPGPRTQDPGPRTQDPGPRKCLS